jgi:hypothetical protein
MMDILELRVLPEELEQLRQCQAKPRTDCHAAFTVHGRETIWPLAHWGKTPAEQPLNVRGWFPLLDKIADEFLIWRPHGGPVFVTHEGVRYRREEHHQPGVEFLLFEVVRPKLVPQPEREAIPA